MTTTDAPGTTWARLDDRVLAWGEPSAAARAGAHGDVVRTSAAPDTLHLVTQVGRAFQDAHPDVPVVVDKGRYLVVALAPGRFAGSDDTCFRVRPLDPGETVFATAQRAPAEPRPEVRALVDGVDPERLAADIAHLAGHPTRHSWSGGFREALGWAEQRFASAGYTTRRAPIAVGAGESMNLLATSGADADPQIVVCAHLDSINTAGGPTAPAPGADDNASGVAGVLEMARLLVGHPLAAAVQFILFGGEEEGLFGSLAHVDGLTAAERTRLRAVLNMDMIGTRNTAAAGVLIEGGPVSAHLVEHLVTAAHTYTDLRVQTSLDPFASDHVPFIDAGVPAVLTIEAADRSNANVHSAADTAATVDPGLAARIVAAGLAALATLP
ncbi:M28 family metallopeptidase [Actinomycetospora aeridis]|uniref:M28 family metallopeptidase n=1 Tax=Actinomycetospora aeridis TaxID=3129231 RepID=A0ABU8N5M9_9PSEU